MRTFLWSGAGSALSITLYAIFVASVGVGAGSDAFFATLAVSQTLGGLLFAPYEGFAQRFALERLRVGAAPAPPLVASYLVVSGAALVPYYLWGEALLGPLFGGAYTAAPTLWHHHFLVLGPLVPLTGMVTMLQVCCQARERYALPKIGLVVSRLVAIALLLFVGGAVDDVEGKELRLRAISAVVVAAHVIGAGVNAWGAGSWWVDARGLAHGTRVALREWIALGRWTAVLKTDQLLERVLAARVTTGFVSLFSLGWSGVVSVVEAFHAAFVVADSNAYHATAARGPVGGLAVLLRGPYRRSGIVAVRLMAGAAGLAAAAVALVGAGWSMGGADPVVILLLLATLLGALALEFLTKQLAGAHAIQDRAMQFVRGLALVYLVLALPRVLLTWELGAVGFCAGLVAYHGAQVWILGRRV